MSIQQIKNQESALSVRNKLNQVIDFVNQMGTDVAQKISALEQKAWLFDFFENNLLPDASASGPKRNQQEPDVNFTYTVDISSKTSGQIPRGIRAYADHWVAWTWKDGENFRHRYYALATSDAMIEKAFFGGEWQTYGWSFGYDEDYSPWGRQKDVFVCPSSSNGITTLYCDSERIGGDFGCATFVTSKASLTPNQLRDITIKNIRFDASNVYFDFWWGLSNYSNIKINVDIFM